MKKKIQLEIEVTSEMLKAYEYNSYMKTILPNLKPLEALKIILQNEIQKDIDDTVAFYRREKKRRQ